MSAGLPRAVVFDLDGTLVDSAPDLEAAVARLLAELGLPRLGLAQVKSFIGEGISPLVERALAAAGQPARGPALDVAVARYKEIYAEAPAVLTKPYPGVVAGLERLRGSGVRLGVCTNKSEPLARMVLSGLGIDRHFEAIVGGDTLAVRKPDPAPLVHTVAALSAAPGEAVYVGDSEIDAATAQAAGIRFALFTLGYRKAAVEALPHAASFDDYADLQVLLAGLDSAA